MNLKKLAFALLIFAILSCKTDTQINVGDYIDLVYYKDKNNPGKLRNIGVKFNDSKDSIGTFINRHKHRFQYFFSGIKLDSLKSKYPDTLAIEKLVKERLKENKLNSNFSKLVNIEIYKKDTFSSNEIMRVASRFFAVVKHNDNYYLKVCGGGNEFKDLNAIRDVSLVEALTYEAIMNAYKKPKNERPDFFYNARVNFKEATKPKDTTVNNVSLRSAKDKLYELMEKDENLILSIDEYLKKNSNNLPFIVK